MRALSPLSLGARAAGLALLLGVGALLPAPAQPPGPVAGAVLVADVEGAIGPATARHVERALAQAAERAAPLVVLRMDTPGGLSDSMREIIKAILASPVPVATYVSPSGARAASAGTYILYASHVAAMAPGTNLGAATPVRVGGGLPLPGGGAPGRPGTPPGEDAPGEPAPLPPGDAMERKAVNDAVAYIRALADLRGRNAEWAERAVREAASLPANEALAENVIDLSPPTLTALLGGVDGRTVQVLGEPVVLATAGAAVEMLEPSWQIRALAILTNPNVAFILLMIGVYGLIFEFSNPGSIGPGVIGAICLLLGLYALNMLPLDYAGLGLLLLGLAFMVAEAFTPTFGVLGIGGLVAFVFGASILLDSDSPEFRIAWQIIAGSAVASAALLALVLGFALRAQRRAVTTGAVELTGAPATVIEWDDGHGYVRARGERWQARGAGSFAPGAQVRVTGVDGLTLRIEDPGGQAKGEQP